MQRISAITSYKPRVTRRQYLASPSRRLSKEEEYLADVRDNKTERHREHSLRLRDAPRDERWGERRARDNGQRVWARAGIRPRGTRYIIHHIIHQVRRSRPRDWAPKNFSSLIKLSDSRIARGVNDRERRRTSVKFHYYKRISLVRSSTRPSIHSRPLPPSAPPVE